MVVHIQQLFNEIEENVKKGLFYLGLGLYLLGDKISFMFTLHILAQ